MKVPKFVEAETEAAATILVVVVTLVYDAGLTSVADDS